MPWCSYNINVIKYFQFLILKSPLFVTETSGETELSAGNISDVIVGAMVSQITSVLSVYSTICSGVKEKKYQSSAPLAFVRGIHWWPLNSPHKGPVTWKMFSFGPFIMNNCQLQGPANSLQLHLYTNSHKKIPGSWSIAKLSKTWNMQFN